LVGAIGCERSSSLGPGPSEGSPRGAHLGTTWHRHRSLPAAPSWTDVVSLLRERRSSSDEAASTSTPAAPGQVFLVGTGPGDPSLLTLRAVQLMQTADVVLYDRLVSDDILQMIHPGARMVYVGKAKGMHSSKQEDIHDLLLQFAEEGATVLRLKGGDPYVFGRGGEELEYLESRGIRVWCVPGITAAAGICAELGIPMTHRGVATSVRFLTGHVRDAPEAQAQLDECISVASDPHTTLVVYMGLTKLRELVATLTRNGLDPATPAVAVERGTTVHQRAVGAPLNEFVDKVERVGLQSPTLLVIGGVCALSPHYPELLASEVIDGQIVPRPRVGRQLLSEAQDREGEGTLA